MTKDKVKWIELTRKGRALPILLIHTAANGLRKYFTPYHDNKTKILYYRQAFGGRGFSISSFENYKRMFFENENKIAPWTRDWLKHFLCLKKYAEQVNKKNLSRLSNKQIKGLFKKFYDLYSKVCCYAYDYRIINLTVVENIVAILRNKAKNPQRLNKYLSIIFDLSQPIDFHYEQKDLFKIAIKDKKGMSQSDLKNSLNDHARKYGFLGMYLYYGEPFTVEYYEEKLGKYLRKDSRELAKKISLIDRRFKDNKKQYQDIVKRLKLSSVEKKRIDAIRYALNISMICDEYYSYVGLKIRPLLFEIGRRFSLAHNQLIEMTNDEVLSLFRKPMSTELLASINTRYHEAVLLMEKGRIKVLTGKALAVYKRPYLKELKQFKEQRLIEGETAFPGKVKGVVTVVRDISDISKFPKGHILATGSTAPQYVPAMKKAKAIVTDEGGVLSHAAIMSREFKIPCIIGTKTGTLSLKDGDKVEVDATKGVVRKL